MDENKSLTDENSQDIQSESTANEDTSRNESELHSILYSGEYSEYRDDLDLSELEEEKKNDRLSTFSEKEKDTKKDAKPIKTGTKKRKTAIIALACAFAVLIAMYLVLGPVGLDVFGFKEKEEAPIVYTTGEVPGSGKNVWLIFEHIERNNIQSIEVHNEHGTYTAYYSPASDSFHFLGAEALIYDQEMFSYLVVSAGYTVFTERLPKGERSDDLSEYGLSPDDDPAYYIITTRDGKTHKLYIGSPTLDEDQYYAMYEGRDIVYVLEKSVKTSLLADIRDLLTPTLTYPITSQSNDYYTKIPQIYLTLERDEPYLLIEYTRNDTSTEETFGVTIPYMIKYPENIPASTEQTTSLFQYILNMTGDELIEYDILYSYEEFDEDTGEYYTQTDVMPEVLLKHGITRADKALIYYYDGYPSIVYFSDKRTDEDGAEYYLAWSPIMSVLTKISAEKVPFLQWRKVDFIDKAVFNAHIDKVGSIELTDKTSQGKHFIFELTGKGEDLKVHETVSDTYLSPNKGSGSDALDPVYNFRQFYKSALFLSAGDEMEMPEDMTLIAQIKMTTRNGYEMNYEFFSYSSDQRCYYTINGEGRFYVKRSKVQKLFSDAQRVIDVLPVDPEADYS